MFKDVLNIIKARYIVAFLNLLLIFINSKVLGREGLGVAGVIYVSANIIFIFNNIFCGSNIIYFLNRYNLRYVFYPAYIWAFVGSVIVCSAMYFLNILPEGDEFSVFALAVLISLISSNSKILLGKDNVKAFNRIYIFQGVSIFVLLLSFYFIADYKNLKGYIFGLLIAHATTCIYSFILLFPYLSIKESTNKPVPVFDFLKEMLHYGMWSSIDSLAEAFTKRLNYFLILNIGGYSNVGLLESGTKISESVWHISNSVSYVEYKTISKTTDKKERKRVTLQLFKFTYCVLLAVMSIVVCVPEWVYTDYLLTSEFTGIRKIIMGLSVGIVAFGSTNVLEHYFIGSGKVRYSAFCSLVGLAVLSVAGLVLIPQYGVFGAALTSSIACLSMLIFVVAVFMKQTKTSFKELFPSKHDYKTLRKMILTVARIQD